MSALGLRSLCRTFYTRPGPDVLGWTSYCSHYRWSVGHLGMGNFYEYVLVLYNRDKPSVLTNSILAELNFVYIGGFAA